jgi:hypothetical protein
MHSSTGQASKKQNDSYSWGARSQYSSQNALQCPAHDDQEVPEGRDCLHGGDVGAPANFEETAPTNQMKMMTDAGEKIRSWQ